MAKSGKGDSKGRGENSGQGATSKAAGKPSRPLLGECSLPGAKKHAGGRPTDYDPAHCETIIELGRKGYSKAMMAAEFDVTRQTLDNWAAQHEEFFNAITRARELSLAWWEAQGMLGIWGEGFNANAYRLQICNRFPDDWREKVVNEHTGKDGGPINITRVELVPLGDSTD